MIVTAEVFTCPMHPEMLSDQPGICTTCGMKLVPRDSVSRLKPDGTDIVSGAAEKEDNG